MKVYFFDHREREYATVDLYDSCQAAFYIHKEHEDRAYSFFVINGYSNTRAEIIFFCGIDVTRAKIHKYLCAFYW